MLETVYATDEDILNVAGSDFGLLLPASTDLASGQDGVCDGWTLTSASTDFASVSPGQVCQLSFPSATRPNDWSTDGEFFVVDEVGIGLTLRRLRQESGEGVPLPSLTGVSFSVRTLYSLIEEASFEINKRLGIDESDTNQLKDIRDLRAVTVDLVLSTAYFNAIRETSDVFAFKYKLIINRLNENLTRLNLRWANNINDTRQAFGMRLSR